MPLQSPKATAPPRWSWERMRRRQATPACRAGCPHPAAVDAQRPDEGIGPYIGDYN
jgi:hypothetical protein